MSSFFLLLLFVLFCFCFTTVTIVHGSPVKSFNVLFRYRLRSVYSPGKKKKDNLWMAWESQRHECSKLLLNEQKKKVDMRPSNELNRIQKKESRVKKRRENGEKQ